MKFSLQLALTILFSWLLQSFFPWWSIAIASFFAGLIVFRNKGIYSFFTGFLGVFLLWTSYSLIIDINSQSILTDKIVRIFTVDNKYILIALTGFIGGLPAGFAALTGNKFREIFKKKRGGSSYYY